MMIECGFVFDASEICPNDESSSALDEEFAPVLRETTVQNS
jgi:hypothetical protein